LKYSGLILLSVVGFKTVVNLLTQTDKKHIANQSQTTASHGFGGGKYGA
jgi:hypothetical protein